MRDIDLEPLLQLLIYAGIWRDMTKTWAGALPDCFCGTARAAKRNLGIQPPCKSFLTEMMRRSPAGGKMALIRILLVIVLPLLWACQLVAQTTSEALDREFDQTIEVVQDFGFTPIQTESPRSTLETFFRLREELENAVGAYWQQRSTANSTQIVYVMEQLRSLIDLSQVPLASRRKTGWGTALNLLDILGRVAPVNAFVLPGTDDLLDQSVSGHRLPGTPIRILEITEGDRAGEFLFSADTVRSAPLFSRGVEDRPLRTKLPMTSWHEMGRQLSGPWIPAQFVAALPKILKRPFFDTPVWKVLLVFLVSVATGVVLRIWHRLLIAWLTDDPVRLVRLRILSPVAIMIAVLWLQYVFFFQVNFSGRFFRLTETCLVAVFYTAATWAFWTISRAFFETILVDPRLAQRSLDDSFVRLVGQIVGTIGGVLILGYGAHELGVPVLSMIAGLGIGGIAVALAIRPTLENLIGGFILFIDKPVRVGDYCTFGGQSGTVENIGVRSTQLRAIDRTQISIPNAQFADMQIVNWAKCDTMLIHDILGLRFETDAEQLRHVLAKIREMLHSHPRIEPETIRVRFVGFGESSLNVDLRIYAKTREWNDFYAIREDVLLRIGDIVDASGTGFAFPSQTLYWGRDPGLDAERTKQAHREVETWRRQRELPFPRFSSKTLEALSGKLKYPSPGSPDYFATEEELAEGGETLSAGEPQDIGSETTPDP
jgi:MscS family membrane protein